MRTSRFRSFVLPGVLAALAAALTLAYAAHGGPQSAAAEQGFVGVYVATHDIGVGTPGAGVLHALKLVRVPPSAVGPDALRSAAQLSGQIVLQPIYRGEQISLRRFGALRQQGLGATLSGRLRAIQVAGDANQLLAGTLRDGDHVDVVASLKVGQDQRPYGRTVLRNVLVMHVASASGGLTGGNASYSAMLRLTDAQAQTMFFVMKNGDWSLVLRPVVHAGDGTDFTDSVQSVLQEGR